MDSDSKNIEREYTSKEIATGLWVSEDTIRRAIRKGKLIAHKRPGNKKTYFITLSDLQTFAEKYCKFPKRLRIEMFVDREIKKNREASTDIPIAKTAPPESNEAPHELIEKIDLRKSRNLIELYNDKDSDVYALMKGTKLKINLIKKLMDTSNEELEKCKELKEQIPETLSSREKVYEMYDQFIHPIEMRILELKKDLAVETFNLENCRLKDADHKIEQRIDAEMAASSTDGTTDAP